MATVLTNTSLQLSHRAAWWATLATFVLLSMTLVLTDKSAVGLAFMQVTIFVACGHASIRVAFERERDFRRSYLYRLRDKLRVEAIDLEARRIR